MRSPVALLSFLSALLFLLPAGAAGAELPASEARFCGGELRPLLQVVQATTTTIPRPPSYRVDFASLFLFRGRAAVDSLVRTDGSAGLPLASRVARGTAGAAEWAALQRAMSQAAIGFQRDCLIPVAGGPLTGSFRITWFGQGTRINRFTVNVSAPSSFPDLPVCSAPVGALLQALESLRSALLADPATEVLATPN